MKERVKQKVFWMLRNLTRGWYLYCHKNRDRNPSAYPNNYSHESIFLLKGNSTFRFNYRNEDLEKFKGLRKNVSFAHIPSEGFS